MAGELISNNTVALCTYWRGFQLHDCLEFGDEMGWALGMDLQRGSDTLAIVLRPWCTLLGTCVVLQSSCL